MLKRILTFFLILVLVFVSVPVSRAENADDPSVPDDSFSDDDSREAEAIYMLDVDQFGEYAEVERDADWNPISVNGYPLRKVRAGLTLSTTKETFQYEVFFTDYPFWRSAAQYDGNLALMSLAMALSANRARSAPEPDSEDFSPSVNLERFLSDAGFTNIREDDYSKETSMYTVSTAMGSRRMTHEGEEPYTLIAIGVCGGGYKNEWQSNMTPGDGDIHTGFRSAAELVIDRLSGYILTNGIEGRIKIWISGFSRAAAVSNLTAGLLVRDGVFDRNDVFAYTFATPAAVMNPPASGFENIFNILNPMDLVPQVMPSDWGYGRFGTDLYLPVTEFSSFGEFFTSTRATLARANFGIEANYSPSLNLRMRLMYSMILDFTKDLDQYNARLQPVIVGIMQNKNVPYTMTVLRDLFLSMKDSSPESRKSLNRFIDYLVRVSSNVLTRTGIKNADQNSGSAALRLFGEHREDTYLASADLIHAGIFEEDLSFTYIMIRGPVNVSVTCSYRPDERVTLTSRGELLTEYPADRNDNTWQYYLERIGNTTVLAVPQDADYLVTWTAVKKGIVDIRYADCSVHASVQYPGMKAEPVRVRKGDTGVAYRSENGVTQPPEGFQETVFTAHELASFIGIASVGINWRVGLTLICAAVGILLIVLVWLIVRMRGMGRHMGFAPWFFLTVFCIALPETEVAYWFFADLLWLRMLWKTVIGVSLLMLFLLRNRPGKRILLSLFPGLLFAVAADVVICRHFIAGMALFAAGHLFLAVSFLYHAPIRIGRWIQWGVLSLASSALIISISVPRLDTIAWFAAGYAIILLLMYFSSGRQLPRIRYASGMFLLSDILLGVFFTLSSHPVIHVIYMMLFYVSLVLMAVTRDGPRMPMPKRRSAEETPEAV